ncbi:hypothetical protein PRZ48_002792 [Zasmidium cellare]|uniref:Uncharacterized protein n=1 Tax=Zasmidium cellare TaxID=395010 RepID=A0ABR0ETN2_ZASCE|nr:hypothetical protein PRZ48_002792 [Zasmidium cellare]
MNMRDQLPFHPSASTSTTATKGTIHWEQSNSLNGHAFEIGYISDSPPSTLSKTNFGIAVDWPVSSSHDWHSVTDDVKARAAITQYALYQQDEGSKYKYILYFTNYEHYDYYFYDETGDRYEVNTYRNGDHYVRFNSERPKIAYVTGS